MISKLEFGLSIIISASEPGRMAPFLGYILKILALKEFQRNNYSQFSFQAAKQGAKFQDDKPTIIPIASKK